MKKSILEFEDHLPEIETQSTLVIYDSVLEELDFFFNWIKQFPHSIKLEAGEDIKNLDRFAPMMTQVHGHYLKMKKDFQILAVGGGSVGDLVGFIASTLKRGVPLIHMPSTWLSAIDSSHGGKNALNIPPFKNQIGTIYVAEKVYLVKDLLFSQPELLADDAMGELWKIALIEDSSLWNDLSQSDQPTKEILWNFLERAIEAKWEVVLKDPYEQNKIRQILNLGHTLAHIIEGIHGFSHGKSVALGLEFSLNFSSEKNYISTELRDTILSVMKKQGFESMKKPIDQEVFLSSLMNDKKRTSRGEIIFIFLEGLGAIKREALKAIDIIEFAKREGWVQ